jgi:hypothetical protein
MDQEQIKNIFKPTLLKIGLTIAFFVLTLLGSGPAFGCRSYPIFGKLLAYVYHSNWILAIILSIVFAYILAISALLFWQKAEQYKYKSIIRVILVIVFYLFFFFKVTPCIVI